jgi:hypothetical protein
MKQRQQERVPRARREGLIVQELVDETLVYDLRRHKAHCLNPSAALIWQHCDGTRSLKQVCQSVSKQLKREVAAEEVTYGVEQLAKAGLIKQWEGVASKGMSRREVIKRMGVAAAAGLPVVTSIVSPSAVQAATCRRPGAGCMTGPQCCSGVCNAGTCV